MHLSLLEFTRDVFEYRQTSFPIEHTFLQVISFFISRHIYFRRFQTCQNLRCPVEIQLLAFARQVWNRNALQFSQNPANIYIESVFARSAIYILAVPIFLFYIEQNFFLSLTLCACFSYAYHQQDVFLYHQGFPGDSYWEPLPHPNWLLWCEGIQVRASQVLWLSFLSK